RSHFMGAFSEVMVLHPCFNTRHFERRLEAMMSWGQTPDPPSERARTSKEELARDIFGIKKNKDPPVSPKPTLSFFAAAAAALALGALISQDGASRPSTSDSSHRSSNTPSPANSTTATEASTNPAALFALSDQALGLFEKSSAYDIDYLVAMDLQILYHLHDGQPRIAQCVSPMVGKMINVARMMGLAIDADEFPGTFSLFDAETRRRVWWDIYYYDVLISDATGHSTLVADNSFTTRLPADVDEEKFSPSSTSLPYASG
ncbi:hypothetical protein K474DRAFT_1560025, partial [Panus rudis PR-1116 ss-1]